MRARPKRAGEKKVNKVTHFVQNLNASTPTDIGFVLDVDYNFLTRGHEAGDQDASAVFENSVLEGGGGGEAFHIHISFGDGQRQLMIHVSTYEIEWGCSKLAALSQNRTSFFRKKMFGGGLSRELLALIAHKLILNEMCTFSGRCISSGLSSSSTERSTIMPSVR